MRLTEFQGTFRFERVLLHPGPWPLGALHCVADDHYTFMLRRCCCGSSGLVGVGRCSSKGPACIILVAVFHGAERFGMQNEQFFCLLSQLCRLVPWRCCSSLRHRCKPVWVRHWGVVDLQASLHRHALCFRSDNCACSWGMPSVSNLVCNNWSLF